MPIPLYMRESAAVKLSTLLTQESHWLNKKRLAEMSGTSEVYVDYLINYATEDSQIEYLHYFIKEGRRVTSDLICIDLNIDEDIYNLLKTSDSLSGTVRKMLEKWRQENDHD